MKKPQKRPLTAALFAAAAFAAVALSSGTSHAQSSACNTPAYYYLTCSATGFTLNSGTRLAQVDQADYVLNYSVNQTWMTTTGDSCFVIETHTVDQYDSCTRYLSSTVNPMIVPSTQSLGVTGNQFTVKYPALGHYKATLTLHSGLELRIESAP
jgi:hypothetical protein